MLSTQTFNNSIYTLLISQDMHNGPNSKNIDKIEHRKEQLYNEVVTNISKVNSIIEDLIVNYEKLKNLYRSDEKISDYSSDAEVDQVYKQKRAKDHNEVQKTTTTKNPFDVATEMFFSEEKADDDDDGSENNTNENKSVETTTFVAPIKFEIGYNDKTTTEKIKIKKLNEGYLKTEKNYNNLNKTDDIQSVISEKTTRYTTTETSTYSVKKINNYPKIGEIVIGNHDIESAKEKLLSNVKKFSQKREHKFIDFDSQEHSTEIIKSDGKNKILSEKENNNEEKDNFNKRESDKEDPLKSNPESESPIKYEKDVEKFTQPIPYEDVISDENSSEQNEKVSGLEDQKYNNEAKKEIAIKPDNKAIDNNEHDEQRDNISKESNESSEEIKNETAEQSKITLTTQETTTPKIARLDAPGVALMKQNGQPIDSLKDFLTKDLFTEKKHNILKKKVLISNQDEKIKTNTDKRVKTDLNAITTKNQVPQVKFVHEDNNSEKHVRNEDANSSPDGTAESVSSEDTASMESESGEPMYMSSNDDEEIGNNNESALRIVQGTTTNTPTNKYPVPNQEIEFVSKPNDVYKSRFSISSRNNTNADRIYKQRVQSVDANAVRHKSSPQYVEKVIHLEQYPDPWNNRYQTSANSQTTNQQPRIFFRDQIPTLKTKKATTSTLMKAISDFYKTNTHLGHADEVLFRRLENTEQSESLDADDIIKKEQMQTRILRKAYGDACLKVVVRKCWKACKAASKDACIKYKCKDTFKTAFKKNAKKTCIHEFAENHYLRQDESSSKTNFVDITRSGYLASACLPMAKKNKPPLRSNASIEEFGPFIQLNILRDRFEKACQKASSEKCTTACSEAVTQACNETECQGHKRDYFKKQCKKDCKRSYRGNKFDKSKDSSGSSGSSEDSSKKCKGSKCNKHKKHSKSKSSSSGSDSGSSSSGTDSSDGTDFELSLEENVNKISSSKVTYRNDTKVGKTKDKHENTQEKNATKEKTELKPKEKEASKEVSQENEKDTAKEEQLAEKDEMVEDPTASKEKDEQTLIRQSKSKKHKPKKKNKKSKKTKIKEEN